IREWPRPTSASRASTQKQRTSPPSPGSSSSSCAKPTGANRQTKALPLESPSPATIRFIAQAHQAYRSLMQSAAARNKESLGGNLLYAGELDERGRELAVASNIAGAASLAASADAAVLRQAMRDGIIDFFVTSLDEALRILKNEIRKRQPVAVAVSVAPQTIVKEMHGRGVLPDLFPPLHSPSAPLEFAAFIAQGAKPIAREPLAAGSRFLIRSEEHTSELQSPMYLV